MHFAELDTHTLHTHTHSNDAISPSQQVARGDNTIIYHLAVIRNWTQFLCSEKDIQEKTQNMIHVIRFIFIFITLPPLINIL